MGRLLVAILAGFLSLSVPVRAQDENPAPYLYYYSDYLNAFVVERADGTDSRMLGQGLIPPRDNVFIGPGWSPSGKWFAWTSYYNGGAIGGTDFRTSYVVSARTDEPFEAVNGLQNAFISWSPIEDILLVIDPTDRVTIDEATIPSYRARISLIDMENLRTLTQFELDVNGTPKWSDGTSDIVWSSDGQFAAFYYRPYLKPYQETYKIVTVTKAGIVEEQPVHEVLSNSMGLTTPVIPHNLIVRYLPDNKIVVVNDPISGDTWKIDSPLPQSEISQVNFKWNSTGDYALVDEYFYDPQHRLWLLSLPDKTFSLMDDSAFEADFIPAPSMEDDYSHFPAAWSPDGNLAAFRSSEDHFSILDPRTHAIIEVSDIPVRGYTAEAQWSRDSRQFTIGDTNSLLAASYDPDTQSSTQTTLDWPLSWDVTKYSPGERYLTRGSFGHPLQIIDRLTSKIIELPISSNATVTEQNIRWHPDERWLIKGDANYMTDGSGFRLIGVTNIDGTIWREIGACYFTDHCANWLPPQVDVDSLPAGASESVLPAPDVMDRSVEFTFDQVKDNLLTLNCDTPDDVLSDATGAIQYTLHGGLLCHGVVRDVHVGLSPDGHLLATVPRAAGQILLWDAKTGTLLTRPNAIGFNVFFSQDGHKLYVRSWRALSTWDVAKLLDNPVLE